RSSGLPGRGSEAAGEVQPGAPGCRSGTSVRCARQPARLSNTPRVDPTVEPNVRLIKGGFDETVPLFLAENTGIFALFHIDSDTYEAARTVFSLLDQRITRGTVILFDEYFGYRGWRLGEWQAWQEYTSYRDLRYEYLAFSPTQVALKVL